MTNTIKINRLGLLKANIGLELVAGFDELQKYFEEKLTDRTISEFERQAGILGKSVRNSEKAAHAIVNASYKNATYSDRIWMYQGMLKAEMDGLLKSGLIQGKHPRELAKHLQKRFGVSAYNANRLMTTELARVQTEAQKQSFERNGYTQYTFLALGTACGICSALNNKHFNVKDMMPGENAPPMHPNCRCSVAAYMDGESYEEWLETCKEHGLSYEEWREKNSVAKSGRSDTIEPEDEGDLYTTLNELSHDLQKQLLQVNNYLNTLGLRQSKWSGRTMVKAKQELRSFGVKKASCDIWLREDAGIKTVIHEHLHARSSSYAPRKLRKNLGFEEGACELLAEEICKREGISYRATYAKYVEPLREFNQELDRYDSDYAFALELFDKDVEKREQWLLDLTKKYWIFKRAKLRWILKKMRSGDEK